MDLKGRNFLTLKDFTKEEIEYLIDLSAKLKEKKKKGEAVDVLRGKNIALIFEKNSTRTRCSFEVAASDLGMGSTFLDPKSSQIGKKESIKDTARVLGRIYDGIEYRGFGQEIVEELARYAGVPVWNGLTNEYHPTQMLADLLTIKEHLGKVEGLKLDDPLCQDGHAFRSLCSEEIFPKPGTGRAVPRLCKRVRRNDHPYRRRKGRHKGSRCDLHRCMGVHG